MIEAAASIKSFRRRDENDELRGDGGGPTGNIPEERLSNVTHQSTTDPEARLMNKGKEANLVFMAHALMGNRHGLVNDLRLAEANSLAEREAAVGMLMRIPGTRLLGGSR